MADDTPNTNPSTPSGSGNPPPAAGKPPVIGVRPITVRPVTPATPAPAPAAPPAGANGGKPATVHLKETAPRPPTTPVGIPTVASPAVAPPAAAPSAGPSTIRLKPTALHTPAPTAPVAGQPAPAPAARSGVSPATIRLKPVVPPSAAPRPAAPADGDIAPTVRVKPVISGQPAVSSAPSAPKPGSAPLPPGPKPLKPEQIQAAKAKTSRISLDAALIGGQEDRGGPKTIRLKRPSDAPVGKITSHLGAASDAATGQQPPRSRQSSPLIPPIPSSPSSPVVNRYTTSIEVPDTDEIAIRRSGPMQTQDSNAAFQGTTSLPHEATSTEESSITRRKTIRVRRPGGAGSASPGSTMPTSPTPAGKDDADKTGELVLQADSDVGPVARTHWFFPVVAVASLFILIALLVVQLAQDSKLFEINAWPPNTPVINLPGMAPIPGRG